MPSVGEEDELFTVEFGEQDAAMLEAADADNGVALPLTELFSVLPAAMASAFLSKSLPNHIIFNIMFTFKYLIMSTYISLALRKKESYLSSLNQLPPCDLPLIRANCWQEPHHHRPQDHLPH